MFARLFCERLGNRCRVAHRSLDTHLHCTTNYPKHSPVHHEHPPLRIPARAVLSTWSGSRGPWTSSDRPPVAPADRCHQDQGVYYHSPFPGAITSVYPLSRKLSVITVDPTSPCVSLQPHVPWKISCRFTIQTLPATKPVQSLYLYQESLFAKSIGNPAW